MLVIFAGLPAVGKSSIAREVSRALNAAYLRIDTIEQALREGGISDVGALGYMAAYGLATENLRLGRIVVADSVNPLLITRQAWRSAAVEAGSAWIEVEIVCSDARLHRQRAEERVTDITGLRAPTWADIESREYHPWDTSPLRLDTARMSVAEALGEIVRACRLATG